MRIYLLQYFCATSQLIYVVKSCVIAQRVTNCWKVSQVYHNVLSCRVLTREYRLNPCEPLPPLPPRLHVQPNAFLFCCKERIVGFLLPKQLLAAALCFFSRCKSANAAVGFIFNGTRRLSLFKPRTVTFVVFLFPCPCCSSSLPVCIRAALTAFCLHLELAINHVCLLPLCEPSFSLLVSVA